MMKDMSGSGDTRNEMSGPAETVIQARDIGEVHVHEHPAGHRPPERMRVGVVPRRAGGFQERAVAGRLAELASGGGSAVVVTQVLAGLGGVGKTQLAAAYARRAWDEGVQVLVWVTASSRPQIVAAYAEVAELLGEGDRAEPERAAERFLVWAETTGDSWLVVLDDVQDPADLRGLWPPESRSGRAVVTTRRRDAALGGAGRAVVEVGLFTETEAVDFLTGRLGPLAGDPAQVVGLVGDLGRLPLALAQAAAFVIDQGMDCAAYRKVLARRLLAQAVPEPGGLPDDHRQIVAAAWKLSIEHANRARPTGLARPLLELAAVLDPNGIPAAVLASGPARAYLSAALSAGRAEAAEPGHGDDEDQVDEERVGETLRVLNRFGLIDHDPAARYRKVRVHQLVQRATREALPSSQRERAARAAADALLQAWPEVERDELGQVLRANTTALRQATGTALWNQHDGGHAVLFRAVDSLGDTGQVAAARDAYADLHATTHRYLGPDHPHTLATHFNLAVWRGVAGDAAGAATALEELLVDQVRVLGPDHPHTLTTRNSLARWRGEAGDAAGAAVAFEELLADVSRVLGPDHPDTLTTRFNLARWRGEVGDAAGAAVAFEELLVDVSRVLGPDHPITLTTRGHLAAWRGQAGDAAGAAVAFEELLVDVLRVRGPDHPDTLATRFNLAGWRGRVGDEAGAAAALEELLADQVRVLGPDHPDTLTTRNSLARWRRELAGKGEDGVTESLDNGTPGPPPETPSSDRPETHPETES